MKKVVYIVKPGIARVTFKALVGKARNSVTMMTGNPAFPTPNPTLDMVTEGADKLAKADEAFDFTRSKLAKTDRDNAFADMKSLYRDLGAYVQVASEGKKELIESAGFDVVRRPEPPALPEAPQNVMALATKYFGEIEVRWGASKGRRIYKLYQTEGDPSVETGWELIAETGKNRMLVKGLERFKTYSFRVVAVGAAGVSTASDAASATAA
ncbi:MAG: fibronectin type III domain-containing protein [Flavobacteriales bacterium]|nr:fibronectin type III domain-containing protein [Flavobacteriales bacterium]